MLDFRGLELRSINGKDTVLGSNNLDLIREVNHLMRESIDTLKSGYTETEYLTALRLADTLEHVRVPYYYNTAIQKTCYHMFRERREQLFYLLGIY